MKTTTQKPSSGPSGGFGGFSGLPVLVTGASGFIGSHLCRALGGAGAVVHGAARSRPSAGVSEVRWHQGDLSNAEFVRDLFAAARPDIVFHLASHVAGARDMDLVLPTLQGNLVAAVHVLREATELGCHRVVLAGSMEEPAEYGLPSSPDSSPTPPSPYAAAKWASTGYARMFHALYGTRVALARIFMVYGPGQRDGTKLVPYVINTLLKGEAPSVGSGLRPVDWIYVDDVVEGLIRMGEGYGPLAQPVDIGSGIPVTIRAVVEEIEKLMAQEGKTVFGARPDRPLESVRVADPEASFKALGWRPGVTLRDGLQSTVEWHRERDANGEAAW